MDIKRVNLSALASVSKMEEVVKEAYKYGLQRGHDLAGSSGQSLYKGVERDYLSKKFGMAGDLENIAEELGRVPKRVLSRLREGFDSGYRTTARVKEDE